MIEVRPIEQIIPHNVQIEQGLALAIGDPAPTPALNNAYPGVADSVLSAR